MKNITLLVTGLLLTGTLASATVTTVTVANYNHYTPVDYRNAEPIIFIERGIEFMVFPNGDMDFNTQPAATGSYYYRPDTVGGRRNQTYNTANANGGVRVEHDYNGRVRRVGNVYVNYDANGRVKRIGSVYMSYNRYALNQIGMLTLFYDNYGRIFDTRGYVNSDSRSYGYEPYVNDNYSNGNNQYYYGNDNNTNGNQGDNYYYRKTNPGGINTEKSKK